jgi:hypothetical protein
MMTLPAVPVQAPVAATVSILNQPPSLVLKEMRARLPRTHFLSAKRTPVPGLTQLKLANGQIVYALQGSQYLIIGEIYDLDTGKNLQPATSSFSATAKGAWYGN